MKALLITVTIILSFGFISCQNQENREEAKNTMALVSQQQVAISNISADECKTLIESNKDVQLIDVRTNKECANGILPNAQQIDIYSSDFKEKIGRS